ncbi:TetR/AcrR family transcriptional regulator [Williamsia deligens]|uniref:TetR/AcrR family transcriptional regulator n=1 Tax=Williamsia deligens TaxID=321325 RepID=A0ABW3GB74_9NOCA|nr:TetR/AcrR family transcriptional regulator [Williamsia deligens]MCP2193226.1 transcriptional regulator, TetR family [Williamsia deligens]
MRSRQKILDATLDLIGSGGFDAASIAAVAQSAAVSRQTVYSIFGSREQLISEAVSELARTAFDEIHGVTPTHPGPAGEFVALIVGARAVMRDHPVLAVLMGPSGQNPLFDPGMVDRARPIAREMFARMASRHPELADRWDDVIDIALAVGLFSVLFESPDRPDDDLAAFLLRWVEPAFRDWSPSPRN